MLKIRFLRIGKKNQPAFKIVVVDSKRSAASKKFIDEVGFFNPLTKEKNLKKDKLEKWLKVGAKPSARVFNLLVSEKILSENKIPVHKKPKPLDKGN